MRQVTLQSVRSNRHETCKQVFESIKSEIKTEMADAEIAMQAFAQAAVEAAKAKSW